MLGTASDTLTFAAAHFGAPLTTYSGKSPVAARVELSRL